MVIASYVINKSAAVVPMHLQIKLSHQLHKALERAGLAAKQPDFVEESLPEASAVPIDDIDLSNPFLWRQGLWGSYSKRLRDEKPVHFQKQSPFGPFWSLTRYDDILFADKNHQLFSAEPVIVIGKPPAGMPVEMFIAMDPPKHDTQRQAVQGVVAPQNLKEMEALIRERTRDVLDALPVGEPFDWVPAVSIELTARMLSTLLDFPYEQRHKLVEWSDAAATSPEATGGEIDRDAVYTAAAEMAKAFSQLWHDKAARLEAGETPGFDLISLMLTNDDTKHLIKTPMEFLGNLGLLIVGGNDTTRNSMSGGVLALNRFPDEFEKLKADPSMIPTMVSEIIRWQTPLAYMRRIATQDVELGGETIRKGDKVVMWYASGNRDERKIEDPDSFIADRKGARNHLSFGFGIHRCMGNRLAELQLKILWEELLARFDGIEVQGEPEYVRSNFVRGYSTMMVTLTPKAEQDQ